jgi:hypothetical protein
VIVLWQSITVTLFSLPLALLQLAIAPHRCPVAACFWCADFWAARATIA